MKKLIWIVVLFFSVVVANDMDPKKLESSCDNGDMDACSSLGELYNNGKGVKQNSQKAVELYQKACDGRISGSCAILGALYADGKDVRQDYAMAKKYYGKACDLGLQAGCDQYKRLNNR